MTQVLATETGSFASPFLKWAGGKGSLIRTLLGLAPDKFREYYEPFLGGGALYFALCNQKTKFRAHLSDTNRDLIDTYKIVKEEPDRLIQILSRIQEDYLGSDNKSKFYYETRDWHPTNPLDSAARLIFLNKTCYNGLYRVNSRGEFNVPFGRYPKPSIMDPQHIRTVSKSLHATRAELGSSDYKKSLSKCGESDFVYLDPPYQPKNTSSFTGYTQDGFFERDQKDLMEEFTRLVDRGCIAVLSNSDTPFTRGLYSQFKTLSVAVNRPINSVGSGRTGYNELIVLGTPR